MGVKAAPPVLVACGGIAWCTALNAASPHAAPYPARLGLGKPLA
jgi:hypothetical protein